MKGSGVKGSYDKQILIFVEAEVQYFSIKPLLESLEKNNISFDLYIPESQDDIGVGSIFDSTFRAATEDGLMPIREAVLKYKIVLSPTDSLQCRKLNYKYLIHFIYAPISVKPNPTYLPEWCRDYHAILCHSHYEKEIMSTYAKTYVVPSLKYLRFEKKDQQAKEILYLPTWQEISSLDQISEALSLLKESGYRITAKIHHGTTHRKSEQASKKIKDIVDEYYESDTPLNQLLEKTDIVLSDNSGSIFEAMYVDIPVVIYGDRLNDRRLGNLNTPQFELVKAGIIANANNPKELLKIIKKGLSKEYVLNQIKFSNIFFEKSYDQSALDKWLVVINQYLNDEVSEDYIEMHNLFNEYIDKKDKENHLLQTERSVLKDKITKLNLELDKSLNIGIKKSAKQLARAIQRRLR